MPSGLYHAPVDAAFAEQDSDPGDASDTPSLPETAYTTVLTRMRSDPDMASSSLPHRSGDRTAHRDRHPTAVDDLPALQANGYPDEHNPLDPIAEDDPTSYDLVAPAADSTDVEEYSLEKRSLALFSKEHLQVIFSDPEYLLKFTSFLGAHRASAVPLLVYYIDTLKSLRAIHYANAIVDGLDQVDGLEFTKSAVPLTVNEALEARATAAFDQLVKEELPAFITYQYIRIVSASISARISGILASHLKDASEGLAEVFCLTDPARPDNPIVFASEEFNRTTQYGMSYVLGKNCRFLQGPWTNPLSIRRLRDAVKQGKQHQEVFLNYRRDGSPFMNLLMIAPLCDSRGTVRYYIGAQVDVSGLVKECADLESYERLLELQARSEAIPDPQKPSVAKDDPLRELSEMLNMGEMSTIRRYGGKMHRETFEDDNESVLSQPRLMLKDPNTLTPPIRDISGKLSGVYRHYLLVRPYPSLRILFASPSQRLPGILQSPLMSKIGGSDRVRQELTAALAEGRGVTAKVRWVSRLDDESGGRNKWIHCTPLIGTNGNIGVWMVVIVDDEKNNKQYRAAGKTAPPIATTDRSHPPGSRDSSSKDINGFANKSGHGNGSLNGSIASFGMG